MMRAFEPAYSRAALGALLGAGDGRRIQAEMAIERLCRSPSQKGDYQERDHDGRQLEVLLCESVLLTFWIDHAVREVRVILIEWPD